MDATEMWGQGHPAESMKDKVYNLLKNNPDQMYTPVEIRGVLIDEDPPMAPEEINMEYFTKMVSLMNENAKIHTGLERLVDEGKVEKKVFEVDVTEMITEEIPDENISEFIRDVAGPRTTDKIYYRIASEFR